VAHLVVQPLSWIPQARAIRDRELIDPFYSTHDPRQPESHGVTWSREWWKTKDVIGTSIAQTNKWPKKIIACPASSYSVEANQHLPAQGEAKNKKPFGKFARGVHQLGILVGLDRVPRGRVGLRPNHFYADGQVHNRVRRLELTRGSLCETSQIPSSTTNSQTNDCITIVDMSALNLVKNRDGHTVVWPVETERSDDPGTRQQETNYTSTAYQFRMNCLAPLLAMVDDDCNGLVEVKLWGLVELSRSFNCRNPPIRPLVWIKEA